MRSDHRNHRKIGSFLRKREFYDTVPLQDSRFRGNDVNFVLLDDRHVPKDEVSLGVLIVRYREINVY